MRSGKMRERIIMNGSKQPKKTPTPKNLKDALEIIDDNRLLIKYLYFDVEATRRERDFWKKRAGGK